MNGPGVRWRRFLDVAGVRGGRSDAALEAELARLMGPARSAEHARTAEAYAAGAVDAARLYATLRTPDEAAVFQSFQRRAASAGGARLAAIAAEAVVPGARLVELGAGHGLLSAFLAVEHPSCEVVGADRGARTVVIARRSFPGGRPRFVRRDYADLAARDVGGSADVVVSLLGIDFLWGEPDHPLRGRAGPTSAIRRVVAAEARPFFRAARRIARVGATLAAVLRAPNLARGAAIADAAAAAGFRFDARRSSRFAAGGDVLLCGVWRRAASKSAPTPSPRSWNRFWFRDRPPPAPRPGTFRGDVALAVRAALGRAAGVREAFVVLAGGVVARRETGCARGFEYALHQAADGLHELVVRRPRRKTP